MKSCCIKLFVLAACLHVGANCAYSAENWPQYKYDCWRSGNVPARSVTTPLGLMGAVPLTDAVFTVPAVVEGRIYVVDGSGVTFCIGAVASNGRLFYTGHGGGLEACQICRTETASGISSR